MATINGSTSRRTANYDFYFTYAVTNDAANKEHVVTVKAYIKCISWDFETAVANSWVHINIGGTVYNRPAAGINCNQYSLPHTYLLWEKTRRYPYSNEQRSVYLRAYTDDLYVAGHGPGVCNASTTIVIPAKYSTAGTLTAVDEGESVIKCTLSGIPAAVGFVRTLKWYYKRSVDSAWTLAFTDTVSATSTTTSFTHKISGLLPGTGYNLMVKIYDGTDLIVTKTYGEATDAMTGTFGAGYVGSRIIMVSLSGVSKTVGYDRTCKLYCKRSTATTWTFKADIPLLSGIPAIEHSVIGLIPSTAYDFKLEVFSGTTKIATFTLSGVSTTALEVLPKANLYSAMFVSPATLRVYWNCFDIATGQSFKICTTKEGEVEVVGSGITTPPTSGYTDVNIGTVTEDTSYSIRIKSEKSGETSVYTDPITVNITLLFAWDTAKVQGEPFELTAEEWGKMIAYIIDKFDPTITMLQHIILMAFDGKPITNEAFNLVQGYVGIVDNDKDDGDSITAADLNNLVTAINA